MTFTIKTFQVDVTPNNNEFGLLASMEPSGIETPIFLRGVLINDSKRNYVIVSVEYCILAGSYYDEYKNAISTATNVPVDSIALQVSHQHDVPFFDEMYHGTLNKLGKAAYPIQKWQDYLQKITNSIKIELKKNAVEVNYISFQKAEVHEYASDRRIYQDGKMNWRSTKCQKPELKALPIGIVDPNLYQCIFWASMNQPKLSLNFFASHPQVADGRGLLSSDAPGVALKKMNTFLNDCFHIYFDGCGADIGNGKFAGPSKEADLEIYGDKLFQAMKNAFQSAKPEPIQSISWINHTFDMPIKLPNESLEFLMTQCNDGDILKNPKRLTIVRRIGLLQRKLKSYPFRITLFKINNNQLVFLPAEMFLEFQTYCIKKFSGQTCVAAYGDGFLGYVPEDSDFALGGYEIDTPFQLLEPGCEKLIKSQIDLIVDQQKKA